MRLKLLSFLLVCLAGQVSAQTTAREAVLIDIKGAIGSSTADYVTGALAKGAARNASVIILRMDTPGGLDRSMREIISAMLASPIPVVVWVGPAGARADSAGTFILYAAHVAAMADTTHLGAATPVNLVGGEKPDANPPSATDALPDGSDDTEATAAAPDTAMERKVLNDAIAYIRGLAESRGRNVEFAEAAVRDAATLTAREALEQGVIEISANTIPDLLEALDGRDVTLDSGKELTLATRDLTVVTEEPTWQQKFLAKITSPEIAVLLLFAGIYGLIFEGWNPGALVPGVVGAICLLLAAYALNVMDVNFVGIGLIILGALLITAEVFVPSFGALGIGGLVSIVIGSIMAFDSGIPGYEISRWFLGAIALTSAALIFATGTFAARLVRRGAVSGREQIKRSTATAEHAFEREGTVWLEGEQWAARSPVPVQKGEHLKVTAIDGLILDVEPVAGATDSPTE